MTEVTEILKSLESQSGEYRPEDLLPLVYDELRRLASARIAKEFPGQSLQTTDLVHEAYLRLIGDNEVTFKDRAHFFGAAAEAMRRILIDRGRKRKAQKRGGDLQKVDFPPEWAPGSAEDPDRILALHDALGQLEAIDKTKAEIVKLRFFAGRTTREVAELLNLSTATTERYWRFARAWLQREMER